MFSIPKGCGNIIVGDTQPRVSPVATERCIPSGCNTNAKTALANAEINKLANAEINKLILTLTLTF